MESLTELIKTYIHNLSVFYCTEIDENDIVINAIVQDLDERIKEIINV